MFKMISSIKDSQKERILIDENIIHPSSLSPSPIDKVAY